MTASRKITSGVVLIIVFTAAVACGGVTYDAYMDSAKVSMLTDAQTFVFNDHYRQADSVYQAYIAQYPDDPAGPLFRAGGLMAEMTDLEEQVHSDLFHRLLDSSDVQSGRILDTCNDRTAAWMYLLQGHATAYRSLWESRFGSMLRAIRQGLSANDAYEDGLTRDRSLYDLYAGLGSYHYWKSAKAGVLRWVGIFRNEKNKGISELRLAADSSLLHRDLAASALIWIRLDQKKYDSAIAEARSFAERYPDGKTFLWPMAQAFYRQQQYDSALAVYRRIRDKLADQPGNYFNLLESDYYIVKCLTWLKRDDDAQAAAKRLNEYCTRIPNDIVGRQRSKVRYLERIAQR